MDGTTRREPQWAASIPDEDWMIYRQVIAEARKQSIPFAVGGAFAIATYTGHLRITKDLDLYTMPPHREALIRILSREGLADYHSRQPYDREWIYRGIRDGTIVDVIWSMANRRSLVDNDWIHRGPEINLRGDALRVLPPEELVWAKLYVIQRDRCDWTDILNILYSTAATLDWKHLLARVGADAPLLAAVMSVFAWLFPGRVDELPAWLWEKLHLSPFPAAGQPDVERERVRLLDSRPWFHGALC